MDWIDVAVYRHAVCPKSFVQTRFGCLGVHFLRWPKFVWANLLLECVLPKVAFRKFAVLAVGPQALLVFPRVRYSSWWKCLAVQLRSLQHYSV